MPDRSSPNLPHKHTRRWNCHSTRRPTSSSSTPHPSANPTSSRDNRAVVVTVARYNAKYCFPSDTRQLADGRYRGALGRYGGKVVVVKETPETLFALVVACRQFGGGGARQFGDGQGAAVRMARLLRWVRRITARWQWLKAAMP